MPGYAEAFFISLATVLLMTPVVIRLAFRTGALDRPDTRKVHQRPIPRIGGLGIYLAFMVAVALCELPWDALEPETVQGMTGLLAGGTLIVLLGLLDDYVSLPAKLKLLGQIACAALAVHLGVRIDYVMLPFDSEVFYLYDYVVIPGTIFWLVGLTNTVNLIDGLDGLAAGVASIASVTIFLVALQQANTLVTVLTAALGGAALGFLAYNFNPARIFMGDSGSMFLGFMLAGISVLGMVKVATTIALVVPILALGLPILDTAFAIVRRWRGGVPIFRPDKGHLHHRLLNLGFTQRQAVLLMYIVSALLGFSAIALTEVSAGLAVAIVVGVVLAVLYGAKKLGIFHLT